MAQAWNDWISSIYQAAYGRMCRVAYRLTGNFETARELVQDAFLLTLFHKEELLAHPKPEAWLMLTLVNLCKNENRRLSTQEISLEALFNVPALKDDHDIEEWLPAKLSERERTVLIWYFQDRLDYREIADRLGISESGGRSCVFRAVAKCRKLLSPEDLSP